MTQKKSKSSEIEFLLGTIKQELVNCSVPEHAAPMSAYMKHHFPFLGVKTPERRKATGFVIKNTKFLSFNDLKLLVYLLWEEKEREFQHVALDILEKYKPKPEDDFIELIEKLIVQKSWWDSVDKLAGNIACNYFLKFPEKLEVTTYNWNDSENMWLNRSAILVQLNAKQKTNLPLLERVILNHAHSNEFFIQKAIGWVLRQYARTNPEWVISFVHNHALKPLSRREAIKHF
jgi:3-methyladenine DNA glycosylase AlkD